MPQHTAIVRCNGTNGLDAAMSKDQRAVGFGYAPPSLFGPGYYSLLPRFPHNTVDLESLSEFQCSM
jgi:hypothetical protein